ARAVQRAGAALAAGAHRRVGRLAEHALGQAFGDLALAQHRRAAKQQRMAEAAAVEGGRGLLEHALLPGRERRFEAHAVAIQARRAPTAAATTSSTGRAASSTRKRSGSAAARPRKVDRTRSKKASRS